MRALSRGCTSRGSPRGAISGASLRFGPGAPTATGTGNPPHRGLPWRPAFHSRTAQKSGNSPSSTASHWSAWNPPPRRRNAHAFLAGQRGNQLNHHHHHRHAAVLSKRQPHQLRRCCSCWLRAHAIVVCQRLNTHMRRWYTAPRLLRPRELHRHSCAMSSSAAGVVDCLDWSLRRSQYPLTTKRAMLQCPICYSRANRAITANRNSNHAHFKTKSTRPAR